MEALAQTKEIVENILEMTESLILTGEKEREDEEADAYALLMEERESLVEELTDLRHQFDDTELSSPQFEEIREIIKKITALDKRHLEIASRLHEKTRASYKEVKQGQRIHAGYNPLPGNEVSSKIDLKH